MGVEYAPAPLAGKGTKAGFIASNGKRVRVYSVQGFDHLLRSIALGQKEPVGKTFSVGPDTIRLLLSSGVLAVTSSSPGNESDSVTIEMTPLVHLLLRYSAIHTECPGDVMTSTGHGRTLDVKVLFHEIVANTEEQHTCTAARY